MQGLGVFWRLSGLVVCGLKGVEFRVFIVEGLSGSEFCELWCLGVLGV